MNAVTQDTAGWAHRSAAFPECLKRMPFTPAANSSRTPPSRPRERTRALGCFAYRIALGKSFGLDLGAASTIPP
jgi:hypothetical protein